MSKRAAEEDLVICSSKKLKISANLGFFNTPDGNQNADNVFVLVAHYEFEGGGERWYRAGDKKDVEMLKETFEKDRKCQFHDVSCGKDELLDLLGDESKLKEVYESDDSEPSVFIFIILSHGDKDGLIYTDFKTGTCPDDYESFNTKDLFQKFEKTFHNSLRFAFLGPCRGKLVEKVIESSSEQQAVEVEKSSSKVSFDPNLHNMVIFYSTVEATISKRDPANGTWLVQSLTRELNEMKEDESIAHFLTAVHNRIHLKSTNNYKNEGQTPEFKIYPSDRKFTFSGTSNQWLSLDHSESGCDGIGNTVNVNNKQPTVYFDWLDPESKEPWRGKLAVIFYQENGKEICKLQSNLNNNLGFVTKMVKLGPSTVTTHFEELKTMKLWKEYGCFAAFFFAKLEPRKDGHICIHLSETKLKPIGDLIHSLLGPDSKDWIGKPKLFFLINQISAALCDSQPQNAQQIDFPKATIHSDWLVFILQNKDFIQNFIEIFKSKEINGERSLQDCLADLLIHVKRKATEIPAAMMVSTLPHLLLFRHYFVKPNFRVKLDDVKDEQDIEFKKLIEHAKDVKKNPIWLLSSLPGSGKSTVMREITFELRRSLHGFKIFTINLPDVSHIFTDAKINRDTRAKSIYSVIATKTGIPQEEIKNLIESKNIMIMFDGFDEIHPDCRDDVLKFLKDIVQESVPIWISTRPHEEETIINRLEKENKFSRVQILPLYEWQQVELFKVNSHLEAVECENQLKALRKNGLRDILSNPLHLNMISEIHDSIKKVIGLNEIYEEIVKKKISSAFKEFKENESYKIKIFTCKLELQKLSVKYLQHEEVEKVNPDILKTGIVSFSNGKVHFVHQTFAEYLATDYFFYCGENQMPCGIFKHDFGQVRKFLDLKFCATDNPELLANIKTSLKETLTKSQLVDVIIEENLPGMFSLVEDEVTFENSGRKGKFHFFDDDEILTKAWKNSEEIALKFLDSDAYKNLQNSSASAIAEMFASAIENNFARLFEKLLEIFSNTKFPFDDPDLSTSGLSMNEFLFSKETNKDLFGALCLAAKRNHCTILTLLAEWIFINLHEEAQSTIFLIAVYNNSLECVELFIQKGFRTSSLCFEALSDLLFHEYHHHNNMHVSTAKALLKTSSEPAAELASRIFRYAVENLQLSLAKYLHEEHVTIIESIFFENGMNILHATADAYCYHDCYRLDMCRWLVEDLEYELGAKDERGWNVLHYAAKRSDLQLIKFLHKKDNSIIKSVTDKGKNAAHLAVAYGRRNSHQIIKYLHSVDSEIIKQKTSKGKTILHYYAASSWEIDFKFIEWLLENGVDLDAVDNNGYNVAHCAATWSNLKTLKFLHVKNSELIKQKTNFGMTALHYVFVNKKFCTGEDPKTELWLIEKGLDVASANIDGWNALHFAASRGLRKNFSFILTKQPNLITSLTKNCENIMHLWIEGGLRFQMSYQMHFILDGKSTDDEIIVQEFYKLHKELITQKTKANKTVLHYAAQHYSFETFKWLVDLRLDEAAVDDGGWNPLHFAAFRGQMEMVEYIHEKWPQLTNKVTNDGENAMHLMTRNGCYIDDAAKSLKRLHELNGELVKQKTKKNQTVLHCAQGYQTKEVWQWLVEELGLEVDAEDDDGWSAIHFAAALKKQVDWRQKFGFKSEQYKEVFDFLHSRNRELIKKKTKRNETALHIAAKNRRVESFSWLIENGVDTLVQDIEGKTALELTTYKDDTRRMEQILKRCHLN
ncbi:uncharacterized protein LOC132195928 isoform X2 [Neocloeon triangulifer]|uniref:uncharacterized protein LOC132195928 isoform X2 n=1 Tax=Neocloeon triangulifer TaxID=2078957 RepID=UPI00286ED7B2|nr:uncharacterized protein LOC132195928 isoform X2 [Neocloeon triangulifer]